MVVRGSGVGTSISSDVCDLALFELAEKHLLFPDNLARLGVKTWLRYRDDILVVGRIEGVKELIRHSRVLIQGVFGKSK